MKISETKYKFIGSKIKEAREAEGLSQMELAEHLGYESATAISLIEGGDRKVSVEDLEKIADFFHKDINHFIGKESPSVNFGMALRADKDLDKADKDKILEFMDFIRTKKNGNR